MSNYDKTRSDLKKLVLPHWDIPRELLNSIARIPDFSVAIVKQCARSHSGRYPLFEEMGYGFD
jgi:hypothetical protein